MNVKLEGNAPKILSMDVFLGTSTPEEIELSLRVLAKGAVNLGATFTYESCYWPPQHACACSNMHGQLVSMFWAVVSNIVVHLAST